ncbi:hypothetical protein LCM17_00570 [Cereibacter sphaeroides]|nr:hypothetical protein [Cereibacter sphaeroides]
MGGWKIDRVTFSSTKKSAEVTLHNEVSGTGHSVGVKLQDISIHDGMDLLKSKAIKALYEHLPSSVLH